jgi:hypothetical protein
MAHHWEMKWAKAVVAGFLGALAMAVAGSYVAPKLGMPVMDYTYVLAGNLNGSIGLAWLTLFLIGIGLALIYATFQCWLPGPAAIRGAIFSLIPWIVVQVIVYPLLGFSFFMGSFAMAVESLALFLTYGLIMGAIYGETYVPKGR